MSKKKDTSDYANEEDIPKEIKRGVNYLLAIAIDKYDTIRPLSNCVKDLEDITDILLTKYTFAKDNIRKLYNADATSDNILAELDKYSTIIKKEDTLTIFFSGHGDNHNEIGFWIPVNARLNKFSEYLSLSTVCDFLEPIKARHILVVADACYSGLLFKKSTRNALKPEAAEHEASRYAITAGRNQKVSDGEFGENSPFADAFKTELIQNENALGSVLLSEKVLQEVNKKTKEQQTPRHGELELRGNKSGQFYFHLKQGIDSAEHQEIGKLLLRLAEVVFDPGIYKVAIKHFEFAAKQAALVNIQLPELIYWKGRAHQGLDEHELAMECFAQFLEQNKLSEPKPKSR